MKGFDKNTGDVNSRALAALAVICGVAKTSHDKTIHALADDARDTVESARDCGFLTHELLNEYGGHGIEAVAASVFRMVEREQEPCAQIMRKPRYVGDEADAIRRDIVLSGAAGDAYDVEKTVRTRVGETIKGRFVQVAKISGRKAVIIDETQAPQGSSRFFVSDHDAETGTITLTRPRNAPGRKSQ